MEGSWSWGGERCDRDVGTLMMGVESYGSLRDRGCIEGLGGSCG